MQRRNAPLYCQNQASSQRVVQITNILSKCRRKVLPSIPDKRNRYGIKSIANSLEYIQKSNEELQREKQIMKNYRSRFIDNEACIQATRQDQHLYLSPNQLHNLAKKLLPVPDPNLFSLDKKANPQKKQRKRKCTKNFSIINDRAPSYQKAGSQNIRLFDQNEMKNCRKLKDKWQFFNSSQVRFKQAKEAEIKDKMEVKRRVGEYLQIMLKEKAKTIQAT